MANDVVLSAGVRQNLLALQNTAKLMSTTQNRLATGKKVNSALDNPVNFFTSAGLQSRARDLSALMDAMSNGVKTLEAADNGITAITRTIESMQSTLLQARQDKSFKSTSYAMALPASPLGTEVMSFSGGAVGTPAVDVELTNAQGVLTGAAFTDMDFDAGGVFGSSLTFTIAANGGAAHTIVVSATNATTLNVTVDGGPATTTTVANTNIVTEDDMAAALNAAFDGASTPLAITASTSGGALVFTSDTAVSTSNAAVTVGGIVASGAPVIAGSFGFAAPTASTTAPVAKTVDQMVMAINTNVDLINNVRAANDAGRLRIENLSTTDLDVVGINATGGNVDGSLSTGQIGGNQVRRNLATQFDQLRDQLDKLSDDASFNGINLLHGDKLKLVFNENSTSTIEIQSRDENGNAFAINSTNLGIQYVLAADLDSDTNIDGFLTDLSGALSTIRSQASNFGSNLSIVQNRQDFTKAMINTLQTGADTLVLADTNEEGANMLALQTRQQLSSTALSLASQADQAVLRLFG